MATEVITATPLLSILGNEKQAFVEVQDPVEVDLAKENVEAPVDTASTEVPVSQVEEKRVETSIDYAKDEVCTSCICVINERSFNM